MDKGNENRVTKHSPERSKIEMNNPYPKIVLKKIRIQRSNSDNKWESLPDVADEEDVSTQETLKKGETCKLLGHELSFIHTMNNDERNAYVNKCLEMSLENKITPKNAFALQLIDCFKLLVQEKQDFPKMACTLDAGAKIYSNRIDALHHQVKKLADEVVLNQKQKQECDKEGEENENETMIKEKRRERKKNIIVSSESLQRKLKGKDPKSRFIKLEGLPGSITNRARRDPKDLSYSLENNLQFWKNWDKYKPLRTEGMVPLPNIKIQWEKETITNERETVHTCQSQDEKSDTMIEETGGSYENISELSQDSLDCGKPATDPEHDDYFKEEDVYKVNEEMETVTEEVGVVATAMSRLSAECGIQSPASCRLEAMKILFKEASDYHYLDIKNVHYWAGPEFWKRSNVGVKGKKTSRPKKENSEILYNCDLCTVEEKWNSLFKKKTKLTHKTISKWKNNKLVLPIDLKTDIKLFFELFHLSNDDTSENSGKEQHSSVGGDADNEISNDNDYAQELSDSSTNPDPLNSSFYEGVPGQSADTDNVDDLNTAFYNEGMIKQAIRQESGMHGHDRVIGITMSSNHQNSFDEYSLIPAPRTVSFEPIKYSARPIQVDMRHLKETMLSVIHEEIEKDKEEKMATPSCSMNTTPIVPETRFSHIIKKLPNRLHKRSAQDLSIAIAFMALLTVTNENNLQLEDTGYSDVIIRLEH